MHQENLEETKRHFRRNIRLTALMLNVVWFLFVLSIAVGIYSIWAEMTEWLLTAMLLSCFLAVNLICAQIYNHQISVAFQSLVIPTLLANANRDQAMSGLVPVNDRLERILHQWVDSFGREGAADLMDEVFQIATKDEANKNQ